MKNQKILIAPLDWGLGHATRSLALAKRFSRDNKIVLAGTEQARKVFEAGGVDFEFYLYDGFTMKYRKSMPLWASAGLSLLQSMPVLLNEKKVAEKIVREFGCTFLISDHRLGFYSSHVPSVFMGHQLQVQLPKALSALSVLHKNIINKYQEIWIPDSESIKLSGTLSDTHGIHKPVKYLGFLSQFSGYELENTKKENDLLVLLSGPEPQRTLFEEKIVAQIKDSTDKKIVVVRGSTKGKPLNELEQKPNIKVYDFLAGKALAQLIVDSTFILGRGGYSSLMDFFVLGNCKLLVVPTPGQTEQEYLAEHLQGKNLAVYQRQRDFNLKEMLLKAESLNSIPTLEKTGME
ncbi:MAG: glycosyltransferase [Luteibaculaceae bacterium]